MLTRNSTLRPGKPPRRTRALRRKSAIRPVNRQRRARLRAEQYGDHADYIRSLPCAIPGCNDGRVCAAHIKTRGAGGKARDLVPLCIRHEVEWHLIGRKTFDTQYGLDLRELADDLWNGVAHG